MDRNEVWIVQIREAGNIDFIKEQVGGWEYREAEQYGYAYDFLVSYSNQGGNISNCKLTLPSIENYNLTFWKNTHGAVIELIVDGKKVEYDLYSNVEGGELISLNPLTLSMKNKFYRATIIGIFYIVLYMFLYYCYKDREKYRCILAYSNDSHLNEESLEIGNIYDGGRNKFII